MPAFSPALLIKSMAIANCYNNTDNPYNADSTDRNIDNGRTIYRSMDSTDTRVDSSTILSTATDAPSDV
jgi:hypothetical protein